MAKKVETQEEAAFAAAFPDNRRYIYFDEDPPELWIGDDKSENHKKVFEASGRKRESIGALGFTSQFQAGEVLFDGHGSASISLVSGDPQKCVDFVELLPKKSKRKITFRVG